VVAGRDVLDRDLGVEAGRLHALGEIALDVVIDLVARRHGARLRLRQLHQGRVERDRAEPVVLAVAGDHRGRRGGIELGNRARHAAVEGRLLRRRDVARAGRKPDGERSNQQGRGRTEHRQRSPNRVGDYAASRVAER
jgi:hypothetical protein